MNYSNKSPGQMLWKWVMVIVFVPVAIIAALQLFKSGEFQPIISWLLSLYPFSKQIADILIKVCGYSNTIPILSVATVFEDGLRLLLSAIILPLITAFLMKIFLPLKRIYGSDGKLYIDEDYMDGVSYKVKSALLIGIASPLSVWIVNAVLAGVFNKIGDLSAYIASGQIMFENIVKYIVEVLFSGALFGGSALILKYMASISATKAAIWILISKLLFPLAKAMIINVLTIWMFLSVYNSDASQIIPKMLLLIFVVATFEFVVKCFQKAIV